MAKMFRAGLRLMKIGAVVGAAVGVARVVLQRRRMAESSESSWPTIAETAARNGHPVDDSKSDKPQN